MVDSEKISLSGGRGELPAEQGIYKGNRVTVILSSTSFILVILAVPFTITVGYLFHLGLSIVFNVWNYLTVSTLIILAFLSIYQTLKSEAERSKESDFTEMKRDLTLLLKYKHIYLPFTVLAVISGLGSLFRLLTPIFSLELVYTAVIILTMEALFHSTYRYWPKMLKRNNSTRNAFLVLVVLLGTILSFFVLGVGAVIVVSIIFGGMVLIGGIGLAFVVENVSMDLSNIVPLRTRAGYFIFIILFILIIVWILLAYGFTNALFLESIGMSRNITHIYLAAESQMLVSGLNILLISLMIAVVSSVGYYILRLLRHKKVRKESTVFLLVLIPVAGYVFLYLAQIADSDWATALSPPSNSVSNLLQLLPSVVLFIVGYSQIIVDIPRKTARAFNQEGKLLLVAFTWLMILSATGEFLSWLVYGQPTAFIFEADILQWFGVPIGIVLLALKYLRIIRKSNVISH